MPQLSAEHRAKIAWSRRRTAEIEGQWRAASRAAWVALLDCQLLLEKYAEDGDRLAQHVLTKCDAAWDRLVAGNVDARMYLEEMGIEVPERHLTED